MGEILVTFQNVAQKFATVRGLFGIFTVVVHVPEEERRSRKKTRDGRDRNVG